MSDLGDDFLLDSDQNEVANGAESEERSQQFQTDEGNDRKTSFLSDDFEDSGFEKEDDGSNPPQTSSEKEQSTENKFTSDDNSAKQQETSDAPSPETDHPDENNEFEQDIPNTTENSNHESEKSGDENSPEQTKSDSSSSDSHSNHASEGKPTTLEDHLSTSEETKSADNSFHEQTKSKSSSSDSNSNHESEAKPTALEDHLSTSEETKSVDNNFPEQTKTDSSSSDSHHETGIKSDTLEDHLSTSEETKSPPPKQKQRQNNPRRKNPAATNRPANERKTFLTANEKVAIVGKRTVSPQKTTEKKVSEPKQPPPQIPRRRPARKVRKEEEITGNTMRDKALRLEKLEGYPIDDYDTLLNEFIDERKRQIENRQFGRGDRLNAAIVHVKQEKERQEKTNLQKEAIAKYEEQKEAFDKELAEFDRETERQVQELRQRQLEAQERLIEQQNKEAEDNYVKWKMESKVRQYNHASYHLVIQRKQLANLLQQCRFSEAEVVQKNIERLEMQERESAYKVMQHDYNESLKKLEMKHDNEMIFFQQNADVQMVKLKQKRAMERQRYVNQKRKIDKRGEDAHDKERVWAAAQTQRIAAVSKGRPETTEMTRDSKNKTVGSLTARAQKTSTTIELPPLHMKKPVRRQLVATARPSA